MALDHLCHPKNLGGLGFMHLHDFNQALLSKAVWRFLVDKDSLCVQSAKAIRSLPFRPGLTKDNWIWVKSSSGNFSFKSAYWFRSGSSINEKAGGIWAKLWKLNIHERIQTTLWRNAANVIPTRDKLHRFNSQTNQLAFSSTTQLIEFLIFPPKVRVPIPTIEIFFPSIWNSYARGYLEDLKFSGLQRIRDKCGKSTPKSHETLSRTFSCF
uniref:Reverse transcriptase zinc-binding domain-containing protein n=1 Tax=Quercus lobata TaxID=97700 RepID=A0A7N2N103_QUELO